MKKQYAFIGLLASGVLFSQTAKDSVASKGIEDVVIVASRKPTKISEIPGTVWVVQKEKFRNRPKVGSY
jgi:iron complex outermembrane receptor protein